MISRLEIVTQIIVAHITNSPTGMHFVSSSTVTAAGIIADLIIQEDKEDRDSKWSKHS